MSSEQVLSLVDEFKSVDIRACWILWIIAPTLMVIVLFALVRHLASIGAEIGIEQWSAIFAAAILECGLLIFLIVVNDRLKECIHGCLRLKIYIVMGNHQQASSAIEKLCISKISIDDLKAVIPVNPIN